MRTAGQVIGLLGPNGSGKSTLLRCLAGLCPRQTRHIRLNGDVLSDMPISIRAKQIAFVPQQAEVDGELSVGQIVRQGGTPYRRARQGLSAADESAVADVIGLVQLTGLRKSRWQQLSGGERQRTQIARARALHDLHLAANDCQHLVLLKSGCVMTSGTPEKVLTAARIEEAWSVKASVRKEENTLGISYFMV